MSSLLEQSLEKRLVKLENELIQIKSRQRYGTSDVKAYTSNTLSVNSTSIGRYYIQEAPEMGDFYVAGMDIYHLRFTGMRPDKTVIGVLNVSQNAPQYAGFFNKTYRGANPNIIEWVVCWHASNLGSNPPSFRVDFSVVANENGLLEVAETWSLKSNYAWVSGGGGTIVWR